MPNFEKHYIKISDYLRKHEYVLSRDLSKIILQVTFMVKECQDTKNVNAYLNLFFFLNTLDAKQLTKEHPNLFRMLRELFFDVLAKMVENKNWSIQFISVCINQRQAPILNNYMKWIKEKDAAFCQFLESFYGMPQVKKICDCVDGLEDLLRNPPAVMRNMETSSRVNLSKFISSVSYDKNFISNLDILLGGLVNLFADAVLRNQFIIKTLLDRMLCAIYELFSDKEEFVKIVLKRMLEDDDIRNYLSLVFKVKIPYLYQKIKDVLEDYDEFQNSSVSASTSSNSTPLNSPTSLELFSAKKYEKVASSDAESLSDDEELRPAQAQHTRQQFFRRHSIGCLRELVEKEKRLEQSDNDATEIQPQHGIKTFTK